MPQRVKQIVGQSPSSCPQGLEKSGGFATAFFLVAYILYMTPYSKCGSEWDRNEEEERGED